MDNSEEGERIGTSRRHRVPRRLKVIVLAVVTAVVAGVLFFLFWCGALVPTGTAAKYSGFTYITEKQVSAYVEASRVMEDESGITAAKWATFLSEHDLTPTKLRLNAIYQMVGDSLIAAKAESLGISVSDDELSQAMAADTSLASGVSSDADVRRIYRSSLLQDKVCQQEVARQTPTDNQVRWYLKQIKSSSSNAAIKHVYRFTLSGTGSSERSRCKKLRKQLLAGELTAAAFSTFVQKHSDDASLKTDGGDDGWSLDISDMSSGYRAAVAKTSTGGVSSAFKDTDGWSFIWVKDGYTLPSTKKAIGKLDLSKLPAPLKQLLSDNEADTLWEADCKNYIDGLVKDAGVVIVTMPDDVPYNVDMSKANG